MPTTLTIEHNSKGEIDKITIQPSVPLISSTFKSDVTEIEKAFTQSNKKLLTNRLYSKAMLQFFQAEARYLGEPKIQLGEVLCYCTGLSRSHFVRLINDNPKKSIEDLRIETKATLMCRGCKKDFQQVWDDVLAKNGAISKLSEKVSRKKIDSESRRVTYKGKYPAAWIKILLDLQNEWQVREDFNEKFQFEIIDAPVPFVDFKLKGDVDQQKVKIYFEHFYQFVEEKTSAKWYFELIQ